MSEEETVEAGQTAAVEEAPKPRRRRTTRAKSQTETDAQEQPAQAVAPQPEGEAAPAPKPARKTQAAQTGDAVDSAVPAQAADAEEPASKPRTRRPRKTAAQKAAEAEAANVAAEASGAQGQAEPAAASGEAAPAAEAPKPRRRRTTRTKTQAQGDAASPAADAPAQAPETQRALTEEEAAALIAAGRARMAAAAAAAQAQAASDAQAPADAQEQPSAPQAASDGDAEAEQPRKRKPRRRSTHATTGEEAEALGEPAPSATAMAQAKAQAQADAEGAEASSPATDGSQEDADAAQDARPGRAGRQARSRRVHVATGEEAPEASAEATDTREGNGAQRAKRQANDRASRNNNQQRENGKQQNARQRNNNNANANNKHNRKNKNREQAPSVTLEELAELKVADLRARAAELGLDGAAMKKAELVQAVYTATCEAEGFRKVTGVLDVLADGYGFLRTQGYLPSETDCYVGMNLIKRNNLRKGDMIEGQTRPTRDNEKYAAIQKIITVNGTPVEELGHRVKFADLTPIYPQERLWMEHGKNTITARVIDLVSPIGKGQRGLIVSPPKAGKTTILKDIAASISANNPEVHLMCLLVDERPEEVTDMQRSINGEVLASTFDMPADNHIALSEMAIERAKRLVESGRDVVILLDSITRLARAYNLAQPASGRVLSGGVDSTALYPPKRFFGAARNIENGGSLTILATGLVETGSKMDEVIFEEFKGTGNMELRLDRSLADRRIYPAIDPVASSTRKEELLVDPQVRPLIWAVRRILANMNNTERAMDMLIKSIKSTENNQEFLVKMARKAQHSTKELGEF